jgi:pectate lyase
VRLVLSAAVFCTGGCTQGKLKAGPYVRGVRLFADTVLASGRDTFGNTKTPLFVDGLHVDTLQPAIWKGRKSKDWVLSNFASQQPLLRLLDGLTALTKDDRYRTAAEDATRYALQHLRSENGLLYWAGHTAWDLKEDCPVGNYVPYIHELKAHQPYYRLMWKVNPKATRKLMETVWAGHIVDWSRLDYNRHADMRKPIKPQWDCEFIEDIDVPFPARGGHLSFVNVTPPLLHAGTILAVTAKDDNALTWTRRLIYRWQQGRHPKTGLCGGQVSYRKDDRARKALAHVHPNINEAKIVASYHQTSRYHHLPLAQLQAAETMIAAGGKRAKIGREFVKWASDDLKAYVRECYDSKKGVFVARMTDGTPIDWEKSTTGYYVPESFKPRKPDGWLFWACAMAYRMTGDTAHWRTLGLIAPHLGLGDLGRTDGTKRDLNSRTKLEDWKLIYGLLELHIATKDSRLLRLASRIGDNILATQSRNGLFPRSGRKYARTGDEAPLAILHLAAAIEGKSPSLPQPILDARFFHCLYYGRLDEHQKKRSDWRTYDSKVFYGWD